ncbi:hypothetical protein CHS0354_033469 [Potamilus streckersoni]|uniref:phosphatidylinositol-3,4-bisphosphate 4-phosphatase n=1 Tax=Potamilus streckersoni TaxID=2493646 RepID=A0AAE0RUQ3_9BIVA|nr:hypothetical protein CHS0354_033469 [Potamilus streckersoni]
MRFNNKELAYLAQQDREKFDKEGILYMKDKNDGHGIFKKGSVGFVQRLFRLRGNLLFYFKGKDAKSEPLGLLILERCSVELDLAEKDGYSFVIVYEGDEQTYTFKAETEMVRDEWIQVLHIASYESLKMQVQSLREQVQARTGQDPLLKALPQETGMEFETRSASASDDPAMEMSISCEGLHNDVNGQPPNPFIVIYIIIPPQQQTWLQHNHTEMVEGNNSPHFLKTIGFGDGTRLETNTRVKITVYHVKERMTGTMVQIGQTIFTLKDIIMSDDMQLKLKLQGSDGLNAGDVNITAWLNETSMSMVDMQSGQDRDSVADGNTDKIAQIKRIDSLRPVGDKITMRTFRFDTSNDGVKLLVHEYMVESKYSFEIPAKLLKLYIDEEKERISLFQDLGKLPAVLENLLATDINLRATAVADYTDDFNFLSDWKGKNFKPSSKKADKELEFVPVNLHQQRMTVLNEATEAAGCYDITTVGAFVAHARKFKNGGLYKQLQQLQESYAAVETLSKISKLKKACSLLNEMLGLKEEICQLCDRLCQEALQGEGKDLKAAMDILAEKVKELVLNCNSPVIEDVATKLTEAQLDNIEYTTLQATNRAQSEPVTKDISSETNWKWTGSCFVKSPTVEPWDMTRVNTEATLVCLISMVDDLIDNKSGPMDRPKWLGQISPAVIKMKSFVEIVCQKTRQFLAFLDLMEHRHNLKVIHDIKCRRDVIFSHAITSLISGFVSNITTIASSENALNQIAKLGILVQLEGLLSCHGEEVAMLEDMVVGVDDLQSVTFRLVRETVTQKHVSLSTTSLVRCGLFPDMSRHHICVEVPVSQKVFDKLIPSLQQGHCIKVIPVLFNIGINEQATLAERFGNTNLQDRTNEESLGKLFKYFEKYKEVIGDPDHGRTGAGTIEDLMKQLQYNVYTKKPKNIEVLRLAAELCRKLHGVRFTCCKSAKDRTAMSVTLEQVQVLQLEHDLAPHVFTQALDCFRSEGVRRENTYKNIGVRKYAFNSLQLLYFPKLYRPPSGTYGNVQT